MPCSTVAHVNSQTPRCGERVWETSPGSWLHFLEAFCKPDKLLVTLMREILISQLPSAVWIHPEPAGKRTGTGAFYKHALLCGSECTWASYLSNLLFWKRLPRAKFQRKCSALCSCFTLLTEVVKSQDMRERQTLGD